MRFPLTVRTMEFPLSMLARKIMQRSDNPYFDLGICFIRLTALRRLKECIVHWYRERVLRDGVLILRNRRDRLPDVRISIRYNPRRDVYFAAAFAMNFMGDIENGCLVIHTAREGTTQRAIEIYWTVYRALGCREGRKAIFTYLDLATDLDKAMQELLLPAHKWEDARFGDIVVSYLNEYMDKTLYNMNFNSMARLTAFVRSDRRKAAHIWHANFASANTRRVLMDALKIALRNQSAFLKADSIEDLEQYIRLKMIHRSPHSHYDLLPEDFKRRIMTAENSLAAAKSGTRVGIRGCYINSETIAIAQFRLDNLWREADRWIGIHIKKIN